VHVYKVYENKSGLMM